jgi:ABC-2 type transport system ATP-binding protein
MTAALETQGLRKSYGPISALRGVDLSVEPGELYGLVGPDGAGKTTTIRLIAGLLKPSGGSVRVLQHDPLKESGVVRPALGYMPQQYSLYGDLSIEENLRFFGRMFSLPREEYRARRERLLHITRLGPFTDRRADALSGGMYKKLALACALLHRPKVLLLDEPTNGVDPVSRRELWALLHEFVGEGMAVVISTPYMDEAARCQRLGLMDHGKMLKQGRPEELLQGFAHAAYLVQGCDRDRAEAALAGADGLLGMTPAGVRVRVIARRGTEGALSARINPFGGRLVPVKPEFEDVFLAETAGAGAGEPHAD